MDRLQEETIDFSHWKNWLDKWFFWLLLAGILVNTTGLFLPVMEPDGALYATISKTMVLSGDFVNLKVNGQDWLDKPHFTFWVVALSFKLFGINSFAYKFPAFLFWLAGAYFTYALAKKIHNWLTARISLLIYVSVEHLIISNNDVRAEPYLTGLVIASAYYYFRAYKENKWNFVVPGTLCLAMAVMTKGIFIPVIVAGGFMIEWFIKKKWREFLKLYWWLAALLLILFITPELICLYTQFDQHPEKIIYGKTHISGLGFFFWDSQFGRFFNSGPIRGEGDPFFYLHTILWAFLPWSIFLIALIRSAFRKEHPPEEMRDYICSGIFITGFLLFSFSGFQLPHYLNFLYPFLSILLAHWFVTNNLPRFRKFLNKSQNIICILFLIFCLFLIGLSGLKRPILLALIAIISAIFTYLSFPGNKLQNVFGRSFSAALIVNFFLNSLFFPELFSYQSGNAAAEYLKRNNTPANPYTFSDLTPEFAFEFYYNRPVYHLRYRDLDTLRSSILIFMPQNKIDTLKKNGFIVKDIKSFRNFHISKLTFEFLNYRTRNKVIDSSTLATISPGINYLQIRENGAGTSGRLGIFDANPKSKGTD
jgi:4-amino-4-deoxy-L-arabinose transferase-like glycosyltransferase